MWQPCCCEQCLVLLAIKLPENVSPQIALISIMIMQNRNHSDNICKNDLASSYKNKASLDIISGRDVGYPQLEEFVQGG